MSDLISRDAVKKIITMKPYDWSNITERRAMLNEIDNLPSVEPEQRWILVTERLPEDGERVLITHKGGVSFGWYNGSYWERGAPTNHRPLETVTAWMPLPEQYRAEIKK